MSSDVIRNITGVANSMGKYTLKGLGKSAELLARGGIQGLEALVQNPAVQEIGADALKIGACVTCPPIAMTAVAGLTAKMMVEKGLLGKDTDMVHELSGILNGGAQITKTVSERIAMICSKFLFFT